MITTQQWRVCIGAFAGGKSSTPPAPRYGGMEISTTHTTTRSWYGVVNSGLCSFSLLIIIMLLICSGNVELNPGPVNCKTCPRCLTETVPIRLKVCTCGYVFHKKSHRQPPNHLAASQPITSSVEVVTDGNPTLSDQVQSQPIGGDEPVASCVDVVNDTVTDGDTVPIVQVQSQPVASTSLKWQKYKANINKKRRDKYRLNSLPERTRAYKLYHKHPELHKSRKRVSYNFNPSPVKKRVRQTYFLNPLPVKAHKREVYRSNPSPVKAHKREVYRSNPSPVKAHKSEVYRSNPSPVKAHKREVYRSNPSPVKAHKREVYRSNPLPVKERVRKSYILNPSPVKEHKREVYRSNPSPVKERVRKNYSLNLSPIKAYKRKMYKGNPSPMKDRSKLAYRINPTSAKVRSKVAYHKDPEGMKYKRRQTYSELRKSQLDRRSLQKVVACAVSKKYKKLRECLPDNFKRYASNVIRTISRGKISTSDVEVEHLVRSCMHFRDINCKRFISAFKKLK